MLGCCCCAVAGERESQCCKGVSRIYNPDLLLCNKNKYNSRNSYFSGVVFDDDNGPGSGGCGSSLVFYPDLWGLFQFKRRRQNRDRNKNKNEFQFTRQSKIVLKIGNGPGGATFWGSIF